MRADLGAPSPLCGTGNLSLLLASAARRWRTRCALVDGASEILYGELDEHASRAAGYLAAAGVEAGDRVGLHLNSSPLFVALYFGILRLGAIVVPQNPLLLPDEVERSLEDAGARLVIGETAPRSEGAVRYVAADVAAAKIAAAGPRHDIADVTPDQTAVILYTSGTTGRPKGAELTHANLGRNAQAAVDIYSLRAADVVLGILPLYHSYGQTCTLNGTFAVGAKLVLAGRFEAQRAASLAATHRVTVLLGVPTMFADLTHCPAPADAFASLRLCASGGAPLPREVMQRFEARAGIALHETYGLSETSPIASINRVNGNRRAGTVGRAIAGTEIRVVARDGNPLMPGEVGEVTIRGHNVMKGYWGNPRATRDAISSSGWFFTGDLGTIEEDGCLRIVGRLKDVIIRGGVNVYPRELEDLLHDHPAVRAAAVLPIPDARLGEEIGAAIVPDDGLDLTAEALIDWVKERVAPFKYPRYVWFVERLPTGPTGKVLKREIVPPSDLHTFSR